MQATTTDADLGTIRDFCRAWNAKKDIVAESHDEIKAASREHREALATIRSHMTSTGVRVMAVTDDRSAHIMTKKRPRRSAVKEAHLREAAGAVTDEEITRTTDPHKLAGIIYDRLQSARQTVTDELVFRPRRASDGLVGGGAADDDGRRRLQLDYEAYERAAAATKTLQRARREGLAAAESKLRRDGERVRLYMDRAGITSQQLDLTGAGGHEQRFYLHRKTSRRTPTLKANELRTLIARSVQAMDAADMPPEAYRARLVEEMWKRFQEVPPITTVKVTLDRAPQRRTPRAE